MSFDPTDPKSRQQERAVARLMQAAGRRPEVPQERSDRVRAAAHATWVRQRERTEQAGQGGPATRASLRRRVRATAFLAAAAVLALAIALNVVPIWELFRAPARFQVEVQQGAAWAAPTNAPEVALQVGASFEGATALRTSDAGRIAVRLESGHSVRLDRSTVARVLPGGVLELNTGAIYVDSYAPPPSASAEAVARPSTTAALTVRTPFGDVEEIGTQFEVRLSDHSVRVRLREGSVVLHAGGISYPVAEGSELSVTSSGVTERRTIAAQDDAWGWATTLAPPFDVRGRSAQDVLEWVSRERGLRLVFDGPGLARRAPEVILGGSLKAVTLEEALDIVLPTCRMRYRIVDGDLRVQSEEN